MLPFRGTLFYPGTGRLSRLLTLTMSNPLDRRQSRRYVIPLQAKFAIRKKGRVIESGRGQVLDVSRTGIFFQSRGVIAPGSVLHLIVAWPAPFGAAEKVEWILDGTVVRSDHRGTAVTIMRYRFERRSRRKRKDLAS